MNFLPNSDQRTVIDYALKGMRIVGFAMTTGVIILGMITALAIEQREDSQPSEILFQAAAVISASTIILSLLLPRILFSKTQTSVKLEFCFASLSPLHRQYGVERGRIFLAANRRLFEQPHHSRGTFGHHSPGSLLIHIPTVDKLQQFYHHSVGNGN